MSPPPPPPRRDDPPPPDASQQPDPTSNSNRPDQTASSRDNQSSDRSADSSSRSGNDDKSAQSSNDCSNDGPKSTGKDKNTDKTKQADDKSADTKSADDSKTNGGAKAGADAKPADAALPQAQAATDAIPTPVAVAATVSAAAVADMSAQATTGNPAAGDGGDAQLPDLKILQVDAQAVGANAAKPADGQTVKHNASVAAKADSTTTGDTTSDDTDSAAANGKPALLANAANKNTTTQTHVHADADAPARHDLTQFEVPAPAGADASATAAAKSGTVQTQPVNMPPPTSGTAQQNSAPTLTQQAVPVAGLAVEIAGRAFAGKNHFEIRLDPPELGRIDVHLNVDRNGQVTSHLVIDRSDTLDLLRRDASGLERALQDAGLKTSDNGLQFSLRDQSMGQQGLPNPTPTPDTAQIVVRDDAMPAIEATQRGYGRFAGMGGGLDIRV